jgi:hypothetical protein
MILGMRFRAAVAAFVSLAPMALAIGGDHANPKVLPSREERHWIDAVKNHRTMDGATVLQVLQYAEQLRPSEFKFEFNGVGYNGATGAPDGVSISYWIGAKRLKDDYFVDLGSGLIDHSQKTTAAAMQMAEK